MNYIDTPAPPLKKKKFETNQSVPERRKWQIVQRSQRANMYGVKVDGKPYKFDMRNRSFETDDQGLAHAIHDSSGQGGTGDVLVIPTEKHYDHTQHKRTFTVNIQFDENGKIIK